MTAHDGYFDDELPVLLHLTVYPRDGWCMLSRHGLLRVPAVWVWMKQAVWSVVQNAHSQPPASGRFFIYPDRS